MTSYVMILADSLESACARYSTIAIQKDEEASKTLSTAFFGVVRACLMLLPVVIIVSYASPYVFNVDGNASGDVQILFLLVLLSSLIVTMSSSLMCVFTAFNNTYLEYLSRLTYTVIQVGLIVAMFSFGTPSLVYVGLAYLISSAVLIAMKYVLAKHVYPQMELRRRGYDGTLFREMGVLGAWAIVYKVGNLLYIQASLVVINLYLGSEAGGGFSIVSSLVSMIHTACYSVTTSVEPLLYKCYSAEDYGDMYKIMRTGVKFVALLFAMPIAFVFTFSAEILTAWVGSGYTYLSGMLRVALLCDVMFCAASVVNSLSTLYLKVNALAKITLVFGLLNVAGACAVLQFTDEGDGGVMWAYTICTLGYLIANVLYIEDFTGIGRFALIRPIALGYLVMGACILLFYGLEALVEVPGEWIPIIIVFLLLFAVYVPCMFRAITPEERRAASMMMPRAFSSIFKRFS